MQVDAITLADPGLLAYAHKTHPTLGMHLSVQGSTTSHAAINLIRDHFGIRPAVLPRVPSLDQIRHIINNTGVKPALIDLGVSAIRVEGRQRSPACVAQVTHVLRQAIHHAGNPAKQAQAARWPQELNKASEEHQQTLGTYNRPWKYGFMQTKQLQPSLGSIRFYWPHSRTESFYQQAINWPVERIYLGEAGKHCVLSCQTLIESPSDIKRMKIFMDNGQLSIEANDMTTAAMAHEHKLPFVAARC